MLGAIGHGLLAAPVGDVGQHGGGGIVGDRSNRPVVPAIDAPDALQDHVYPVTAPKPDQPLGVVKLDDLGVGLGVFLFNAQDRRPAAGDGLAGVIRDLARSGQGDV